MAQSRKDHLQRALSPLPQHLQVHLVHQMGPVPQANLQVVAVEITHLKASEEISMPATSDMSDEELDLWSDINNPNNDADMDDWADAHNPNNDDYLGE